MQKVKCLLCTQLPFYRLQHPQNNPILKSGDQIAITKPVIPYNHADEFAFGWNIDSVKIECLSFENVFSHLPAAEYI